ncbi:HTH_Tnp_Tc3_2 domain-containing protein [Trichonephila clavipes]|nr:HTH_Tnp_Tc3_2 domain-containing protein [Trichonephila clavipes]
MDKLPDLDVFDCGQIVSQITTQLNDGACRTLSKRTVQRSIQEPSTYKSTIVQCSPSGYTHLAWAREHRDWSVEDWKRVAFSHESRFQLLNADWRLLIWRQSHEAMDVACPARSAQRVFWLNHGVGYFSWH